MYACVRARMTTTRTEDAKRPRGQGGITGLRCGVVVVVFGCVVVHGATMFSLARWPLGILRGHYGDITGILRDVLGAGITGILRDVLGGGNAERGDAHVSGRRPLGVQRMLERRMETALAAMAAP